MHLSSTAWWVQHAGHMLHATSSVLLSSRFGLVPAFIHSSSRRKQLTCKPCNALLQVLQDLVNNAAVSSGLSSWGVVVSSVLLVLVSAVLGEWLWTRLKYDMHKIPMAPNSVPVLGELHVAA
jgi:hypothetical protein